MIDEETLEELFRELADGIEVPSDGAGRIVAVRAAQPPARMQREPRNWTPLWVAAAIVVVAGLGISLAAAGGRGTSSKSSSALVPASIETSNGAGRVGAAPDTPKSPVIGGGTTAGRPFTTPNQPVPPTSAPASRAPNGDAPKVVKTASLDLQVPRGTVRASVNRVTNIAAGLGGYVATSKTDYSNTDPNADVTVRVPVDAFDTAISGFEKIPGVTVLDDERSGRDVTSQYTDLQARLQAATAERDSLLVVLSHAQSIGDILSVRDRVSSVQTEIDQLQGQINVLGDQASFSSITISLSEKPAPHPAPKQPKQQSGIAKAWDDGRHGFTHGVEWLLARSGGALIVLIAALAMLFGVRYLYPVVRRGLM